MCNGSGYELRTEPVSTPYYAEPEHIVFAYPCSRCKGITNKAIDNVRNNANIPTSFYESDLSSFDWYKYQDAPEFENYLKQKKYIESFVSQFDTWNKYGTGFYICSSMKGSGKTFLASCICNSLMKQKAITTHFVSVSNLINIAKSGSKDLYATDYERNPLLQLKNCKLLVLDDIGAKTTGNDWLNDILFEIIDERYQKKLITIFTSNIKPNVLKFDDRILDRINKMTVPINIPEICVRSQVSKESKKDLFKELGMIK